MNRFATHGLQDLADELEMMTATVVNEASVSSPDLRSVLRFINKVLQVVDQAFEDVYAVLIDVKLLGEKDVPSDRVAELRRSLAMLRARSRYRDAEEICSRLHHLTEEYDTSIQPIVEGLGGGSAWPQVFHILDEYEGRIILLVEQAVYELDGLLANLDQSNLSGVTAFAAERAESVHRSLNRLVQLRNKILGLSGEQGLLELMSSEDRREAASAMRMEVRMGDVYNVKAAGAVGPRAKAKNVRINQAWQELESKDTKLLASELSALRTELRARATEPEHDLATAEVASAQLAAEKGDGPGAMAHLARAGKWVLGIATSIGTTVAAAAIKSALGL